MKKYLITLLSCLMIGNAYAKETTKEDLVGEWSCTTKKDHYFFKSLMTLKSDGTAHEKWANVLYLDYEDSPLSVTALAGRYKWKFVPPSHYTISDVQIDDFRSFNSMLGMLDAESLEAEKEALLAEVLSNTDPIKVEFIDQNHMKIVESEYDCKRINQ